jgi:hypothetical protein
MICKSVSANLHQEDFQFKSNWQFNFVPYWTLYFGPNREEVAGDWRRLHNEELHNLYTSQNISRMIKSRRMKRVGHVAHMGKIRNAYKTMVR